MTMQAITRRKTLLLLIGGSTACFTSVPAAQAQAKVSGSHDLGEAIRTFNAREATIALGKTQPPLTEDEVIAALRWVNATRTEPGVTDAEYTALLNVAQTRQLSPGAELEVLTEYEPDDKIALTVWSVRLRMPRGENGGTYAFTIREQMVSSRLIGPEERKVIHSQEKKWREQKGVGSFDPLSYAQERRRAAQIDQAMPK